MYVNGVYIYLHPRGHNLVGAKAVAKCDVRWEGGAVVLGGQPGDEFIGSLAERLGGGDEDEDEAGV